MQTFDHMDYKGKFKWELEVPNGMYNVIIGAGDLNQTAGDMDITAEGTSVVAFKASVTRTKIDSAMIEVKDGRLTIDNAPTSSANKICYIIVKAASSAPEKGFGFLSPTSSQTIPIGGTLNVVWNAAPSVPDAILSVSTDAGRTWVELNSSAIKRTDAAAWGHFEWTIPAELNALENVIPLEGKSLKLKLANYDNGTVEVQPTVWNGTITVGPGVAIRRTNLNTQAQFQLVSVGNALRFSSSLTENSSISLLDIQGRVVLNWQSSASSSKSIEGLKPGVYSVRVQSKSVHAMQRIVR
jgi:hypothetical protein